jgi:hypothetical protein
VRERRWPLQPNEIGPSASGGAPPSRWPIRASGRVDRGRARPREGGGIRVSEHGIWRVLRRLGLNTAPGGRRSGLATATPTHGAPRPPDRATRGELRANSSGSTAFSLAARPGAELHASERNPRGHCRALLAARPCESRWPATRSRRSRPTTARSSAPEFAFAVERLGARQRFIRAGRRPRLARRAARADPPRGALASALRPRARSCPADRPRARRGRLPGLRQHRPSAHGPHHPRAGAGRAAVAARWEPPDEGVASTPG